MATDPILQVGTRYWVGIRDFDVAVERLVDGTAVRLELGIVMGEGTKRLKVGCVADPVDFVSGLAGIWPEACGHHGGNPAGVADIGQLFGARTGKAVMKWSGSGLLRIFDGETVGYRKRADSVIPVEVLKTVGDLLAELCPDGAVRDRWMSASAITDVTPFEVLHGALETAANGEVEQARWYAGKIGVDPETYINGAIAIYARHMLWATTGAVGPEMTAEERDPRNWAPVDRDTVMEAAGKAAANLGWTIEQFVGDAIASTNGDVRAEVVFGRSIWSAADTGPTP